MARASLLRGWIWTPAVVALTVIAGGCGSSMQHVSFAPMTVAAAAPAAPKLPKKIAIKDRIEFEVASAKLLPESLHVLDQVVEVLQKNPAIKRVEIQGHTDARGSVKRNRSLSLRRAQAVRAYLLSKGIDGERLDARGYGPDRPLVNEDSDDAYAKNRRVEFIVDANTGREEAQGG